MASPLPVTFKSAPLPFNFSGTPQQFLDAIVARLYLESGTTAVLISSGPVLPTSDQGPFLLNGNTWYVWDPISGSYVPITVPQLAALNTKPFRGNLAADQKIILGSGPASGYVDLVLVQDFDPDNVFAPSSFTAPDNGFYHIDCKCSASANTAPTDGVVTLFLKKNGVQMATEITFGFPATELINRVYLISTDIQLVAGDLISSSVSAFDTTGTIEWTIHKNDTYLSGFKIKNA